jgi:hypothetical protein
MHQDAERVGVSKEMLRSTRYQLNAYSHEQHEELYGRYKHLLPKEEECAGTDTSTSPFYSG